MRYTPIAILVGLLLELIDFVLARYATTVPAGHLHPEFRAFQYGKRYEGSWGADGRWRVESFFILKLPSWRWVSLDYGRNWGWGQLCLVWTDTEGWRTWHQPCERN